MFDQKLYYLSSKEFEMLENIKQSSPRLGAAVSLKFLQEFGFFPSKRSDVPMDMVISISSQMDIPAKLWSEFDFSKRSSREYRERIRTFLGYKSHDKKSLVAIKRWVLNNLDLGTSAEKIEDVFYQRFRETKIIPPSDKVIKRIAVQVREKKEAIFYNSILKNINAESAEKIDELLSNKSETKLSFIKSDTGKAGIESLKNEANKLKALEELNIPDSIFTNLPKPYLSKIKRRVSSESLHELKRRSKSTKYPMIAIYTYIRKREIVDGITDQLIQTVHKIGAKAEKKVTKEYLKDFIKNKDKDSIFINILNASLASPEEKVCDVVYPEAGGEEGIRGLIKALSNGPVFKSKVKSVMRASYQGHYRRMIPIILDNLEFQSNNSSYQPILDGIRILKKYRNSKKKQFPNSEKVPIDGVVKKEWHSLVFNAGDSASINRINYEMALLVALREKLRCKEIWIDGSLKYGNPDKDLPQDFDKNRNSYFEKLGIQPSSKRFIKELKSDMLQSLQTFNNGILNDQNVQIIQKSGKPHILLSPFDPQAPAKNLESLKTGVHSKWPMTGLLDVLKETELRTGFTKYFETIGSYETMDKTTLQKRLLLSLFGLGTNMGLKRVCTTTTGENEQDLFYIKRKFINRENLRSAISHIANNIIDTRLETIWGSGTTSCASDSKKFGSWDQNLLTEWHIRYRGRGVMIYWHVDKKSLCVYSQLKSCSSSEVASMIQGVLSHNTDAEIEKNYVDSHGQSEVAFAFCNLLGFSLMPRLKAIHKQKLSVPSIEGRDQFPNLKDIIKSKPINWELIEQQYDEMVKHVAAIKLGFSDAETILKRFTRNNERHPTYLAFKELGKAIKTIFLCKYLSDEDVRIEINEGLNVVENWNSANSFIFFGKNSEISSNSLAEQEVAVLALHLLQISLVYINTIMLQQVIEEERWLEKAEKEDLRAITPLTYSHINPYGSFTLDMDERLPIAS